MLVHWCVNVNLVCQRNEHIVSSCFCLYFADPSVAEPTSAQVSAEINGWRLEVKVGQNCPMTQVADMGLTESCSPSFKDVGHAAFLA